jgi:SAM-dependent methyltransferase
VSSPIAETLARIAVSGSLIAVVLRQCRKPSRWVGRAFLAIMNRSHLGVTKWGLAHVAIAPDATVLDVGCGGGRTVATLAAATPQGHVDGVDYSAESIAVTRRTNADAIARGCVTITPASVAALPFPDAHFDLVTAVETHYYWPDLAANVREIGRVLRPGGHVVVIAETYRGRPFDWPFRASMALLRAQYLSAPAHAALLRDNGFVDVTVYTDPEKGWLCAVGRHPT